MTKKYYFINTMIILLYLWVLLIVLVLLNNTDTEYNNFIKQISQYESYNSTLSNQYYTQYLENNNIVLSLNQINHPDFYNYNLKSSTIDKEYLTLINKKYYVSDQFTPKDLVIINDVKKIDRENEIMKLNQQALNAYKELYNESLQHNLNLYIFSAYRTYHKQQNIYMNAKNKSYVAEPGHSEHQTGLVIDISTLHTGLTIHFENTPEFEFLQSNAANYGYILRYPKDKEYITGYSYEPWHYRYVGIEAAKMIKKYNITLEEYIYNYIPL